MKKLLIILFSTLLFFNSVSISAGAGESFVFCYTKDSLYETNEMELSFDTGERFVLTVALYEFIRPDSIFCLEYDTEQAEVVSYLANIYKFDNSNIDYDEEYHTSYQWGNIRFHMVAPGKVVFSLPDSISKNAGIFSGVINSFQFEAKNESVEFRFYIQNNDEQPEQPPEEPPQEDIEDITAVCYTEGDYAYVSGTVREGKGDSVSLMLYDDARLFYIYQVMVIDDTFSFCVPLPDSSKNGTYTAKLTRRRNGNSICTDFERSATVRRDIVVCDVNVEGNAVIFSGSAPTGLLNTIALTVTNLQGKLCYITQTNINKDGSFVIRANMKEKPIGTIYIAKLISYGSLVTSNMNFVY